MYHGLLYDRIKYCSMYSTYILHSTSDNTCT